ncbi:thiopeptide-type bacteriocin biosynthesis protein [Streptomyces sp. NPDC053474]|uniref:thiopeptide-type bacteriocin biosynthesis protein n=1 Tax=Streptomyces sp. NPDC053474 TaxID=3365704 RepID=UPI0037D0D71A
MEDRVPPQAVQRAVLAALSGAPLDEAAAKVSMRAPDLADAITTYKTAGYAALEAHHDCDGWHQVHIEFPDWHTAEEIAVAHLWPMLRDAESAGVSSSWWFIRKAPCWRLRLRPGANATPTELKTAIGRALDSMQGQNAIRQWWETIYEAETFAFGGTTSMDIAHRLFHHDSRGVFDYLSHCGDTPAIGRRELSILLCSLLMRSADQEWHEQGDIWSRVAMKRPLSPDVPLDRVHDMAANVRKLMMVDAGPTSTLVRNNDSLTLVSGWFAALEEIGDALGSAARHGLLDRGVRAVLAHHVIFHWNRLGLPTRTQSALAWAARTAILGEQEATAP